MYRGEVVYIHVAQGSGLCSCHSNTKSVQCIRVAITTRQVSAVIVRLLVVLRAIRYTILRTRRDLNTTEPRRQRAAFAAAAPYYRLCT